MRKQPIFLFVIAALLTACTASPPASEVEEDSSQDASNIVVQEDALIRETNNVVYEGVIKPAGISIYQQGSHRLMLQDGRFILLESDSVDLNGYVNEKVEVRGALRPTVEDGGMIMRVEQTRLLDEPVEEPEETENEEPTDEEESTEETSDDQEGETTEDTQESEPETEDDTSEA